VVSGVGERGGQVNLLPHPPQPNWHFSLTQVAVTTDDDGTIFASAAPRRLAASSHWS
jgi:hypothetical protein